MDPPLAMSPTTTEKDFGFLPIPRRLRRTEKPVAFGLVLNVGFGIASTFTVGNLYYCQPLLVQMSNDFGVTYGTVSRIPTLVQAGYAVGLVLITPLGDLVRRRPLLLLLVLLSASLTIGLAVTRSFAVFETLTFFVGVFTVTPQVLLPLAADLAPPDKRASAISVVLSGLLFGILVARVLAGIVAEFASWRIVFYLAIGVQYAVLLMLYLIVPDYPAKNAHLRYQHILFTMAKFSVTEPVLIQAMMINSLSSACFSNFWVTLTFLLAGPPYRYSTLVIGLFGLVGMAGVSAAPFTGRLVDRTVPWCSILITTVGLLIFAGIQTAAAGLNIAAVILVCFFTDIFRQMQQVSVSTVVMGTEPAASARLNAVLILFNFIGQVMGTAVGTRLFVQYGWRPAAAISVGWTVLQLVFLFLRGPHCDRYTWFGYEHGCELRKSKALENERKRKEAAAAVETAVGSTDEKEVVPASASLGRDEEKV